ncbi:unnamed protein product [Didymodactylos carnosus]|uniref:Ubiquitin carboxyl-terminal hydrolase 14 n=1 Tax=Didymodactylos carnosus TaxID=1234261 RepID=A0A813W0W3_9BILA|nr:unnamed protein product [Didymodactylos carnosus]CAF1088020.1 unnamed protein product [Didymodactylos carnosus]CAF3633063.1 unnamed protein product [Didymodactylos carnosus]CAF3849791.1 unnamed protein product [Didymodactylos carnosus]
MATVKVSIKWNKEVFKDIEVDMTMPPAVLKAQLFSLTNVPIERQKIMIKGQTIGDDSWGKVQLTNGLTLLLMGSADAVPELPAETPKFLEDMTEQQIARAMQFTGGLKNLGNTCYMNATLQCLKSVPELRDSIKQFHMSSQQRDGTQMITNALKTTYQQLESNTDSFMPLTLLASIHREFPRFAEKDDHGHLMQQDANEFWVQMMHILQMNLQGLKEQQQGAAAGASSNKSLIDQFFGITIKATYPLFRVRIFSYI